MADDNDNVAPLHCITTLDIPVERILERAGAADLKMVVVMGERQDGERYFASSVSSGPEIVWLIEKVKRDLLAIGESDE